jgi:hypothetical protein
VGGDVGTQARREAASASPAATVRGRSVRMPLILARPRATVE